MKGARRLQLKKKKGWNFRNWPSYRKSGIRRYCSRDMPPLRLRVKIKQVRKRNEQKARKGVYDLYRRNYWGQWNVIARFDNEEDACDALAKELGVEI